MRVLLLAISLLALVGCSPHNLTDCKLEASKAPTQSGALMAMRACDDKFAPNPFSDPNFGKDQAKSGSFDPPTAKLLDPQPK